MGGNITTPELLHRVEPLYPDIAVRAHIQGVSILEATVDETGQVTDVRVLRTASALLDRTLPRLTTACSKLDTCEIVADEASELGQPIAE